MTGETSNSNPAPTRPRLAYMDCVEAAALLRTDRLTVLEYVQQGKLKPYGGKKDNPFVRTEDVEKLASELLTTETATQPAPDPKTVHRNDPVRKLKLRIQQDAKWYEVDEKAMRAWARELDPISYERMRQVARDAIGKLEQIINVLDETEAAHKQRQ
jgi:hypothetical protein